MADNSGFDTGEGSPAALTTNPFDDDKLHEECGVFGIFGNVDAAAMTALGLHALQHRGQEAAGIVTYDGKNFNADRRLGLVGDKFTRPDVIERLQGDSAIGHVRYSTSGGTVVRNTQPLFADLAGGGIALAHNGNLTNARTLHKQLVQDGAIFQTTSDTENIIHLTARSREPDTLSRLADALHQVEGAFSLVALSQKKLIGVRDAFGVRPLVLGRLDDSYILTSETCALDIIGAEFIRDIEPGEMVVITRDGIQSHWPFQKRPQKFCIFEYVYFARPDSLVEGRSVYEVRKRIGAELARERPVEVDIVVPVPDSGVPGAIGYAAAAGVPFDLGIIRNHYVGRTFIEPTDQIRHLGVKLKHNANRALIEGKRVVLIDDSIVRGTTSVKIVQMMREAGAKEVHMRIASPPTTDPCYYGVDTPEKGKLLAARMSVREMEKEIGVDSLEFLSIDGLYRAVGEAARNNEIPQFCDACFTGDYPVPLVDKDGGEDDRQLSLLTDTEPA
jgi:amidophosphoribosyltransferase